MRRRKRKKVADGERKPLLRPAGANQVWFMGCVFDRTAEGRVIKCLTIVDDATHNAVAIEVERAMSGQALTRVLDLAARVQRGETQLRTHGAETRCLCETPGRASATVTPDFRSARYPKRGTSAQAALSS